MGFSLAGQRDLLIALLNKSTNRHQGTGQIPWLIWAKKA
jgi:hypothetical protein